MVYSRSNHQKEKGTMFSLSPFSSYEEPDISMEDMTTPIKKTSARSKAKKTKVVSVASSMPPSANVCRSCHALPVGSMDLTALMLVLVFSLTAVLFTTVYALNLQKSKVAQLESQVAAYHE